MNPLSRLIIDDHTFCWQDRSVGVHCAVITGAGVSSNALEKKSTGKNILKYFGFCTKTQEF